MQILEEQKEKEKFYFHDIEEN